MQAGRLRHNEDRVVAQAGSLGYTGRLCHNEDRVSHKLTACATRVGNLLIPYRFQLKTLSRFE